MTDERLIEIAKSALKDLAIVFCVVFLGLVFVFAFVSWGFDFDWSSLRFMTVVITIPACVVFMAFKDIGGF
jgi:uncharacterized protein (DUF983 family)